MASFPDIGGGGVIDVPSDQIFAGANKAACIVARDAFFTANPTRLIQDAYCVLNPADLSYGLLEQYRGSAWVDISQAIAGKQGTKGDRGESGKDINYDDAINTKTKDGNPFRLIGTSSIGDVGITQLVIGDQTEKFDIRCKGAFQGLHLGYLNTLFSYTSEAQTGDPVDLIDLYKDGSSFWVAIGDKPSASGTDTAIGFSNAAGKRMLCQWWDKASQTVVREAHVTTDYDIADNYLYIQSNHEVTTVAGNTGNYTLCKTDNLATPHAEYGLEWGWANPPQKEIVMTYNGEYTRDFHFEVSGLIHSPTTSLSIGDSIILHLEESIKGDILVGSKCVTKFDVIITTKGATLSFKLTGMYRCTKGTVIGVYAASDKAGSVLIDNCSFKITPAVKGWQ